MLSIAAKVAKRVEETKIDLWFLNTFILENMPDDAIINLLDNIENRL